MFVVCVLFYHYSYVHLKVLNLITNYSIFICDSKARDITLGILYGYKAVIQVIALIFTFSIRKVKIKGLNDANYIAIAVYVTSIVTAVIIVSTYTLEDYINVYAAVFSCGFIIGTTVILMLVFVPKVSDASCLVFIYFSFMCGIRHWSWLLRD